MIPFADWETDKLDISPLLEEKVTFPFLELELEFAETPIITDVLPELPLVGDIVIQEYDVLAVHVLFLGQVTVTVEVLAAYPKDRFDGSTVKVVVIGDNSIASCVTETVFEVVQPFAVAVTETIPIFSVNPPEVAVTAPVNVSRVQPDGQLEPLAKIIPFKSKLIPPPLVSE